MRIKKYRTDEILGMLMRQRFTDFYKTDLDSYISGDWYFDTTDNRDVPPPTTEQMLFALQVFLDREVKTRNGTMEEKVPTKKPGKSRRPGQGKANTKRVHKEK